MRFEQLKYLISISHYHSMNLAADALYVTPQTLSASIKHLESELGIIIFERTNKGVHFTENGKKVLQFAQTAVSQYEQLQTDLKSSSKSEIHKTSTLKGELKIYSAPVFLETMLMKKIMIFKKHHPLVTLHVEESSSPKTCKNILESSSNTPAIGMIAIPYIDNSIVHEFIPNGKFFFQPLSVSHFFCCVPKDSPYAKQQTISIKKVLENPLVLFSHGTSEQSTICYLLKQYTDNLNIASSVSSLTFGADAIKNGLGIGFLNKTFINHESLVNDVFDSLVFIKVKEPLISVNGFIYTDSQNEIIRAFKKEFPSLRSGKKDPVLQKEYLISDGKLQ